MKQRGLFTSESGARRQLGTRTFKLLTRAHFMTFDLRVPPASDERPTGRRNAGGRWDARRPECDLHQADKVLISLVPRTLRFTAKPLK
jgi:hypothetical protein